MWLGDAVAGGGVSVGFDVGGRVFALGGVSGLGSVLGSCSSSGGVVVCVSCAVRVFGGGWCSLVLRRWARGAGVDVAKVSGLFSSDAGCVPASGWSGSGCVSTSGVSVSSARSSASVSGSVSVPSVSSRVGVVLGVLCVRDWGARVGVGGGVVSGGGCGWWLVGEGCGVRARVGVQCGRVGFGVSGCGWCGGVGECGRVGGIVGCVLDGAKVIGLPRVLLFRVGVEKAGREPVVWFSPRFFFFLCGADDGGEPATSTLAWWHSTRLSYMRVSRRPALLVACFCLPARGATLVPTC